MWRSGRLRRISGRSGGVVDIRRYHKARLNEWCDYALCASALTEILQRYQTKCGELLPPTHLSLPVIPTNGARTNISRHTAWLAWKTFRNEHNLNYWDFVRIASLVQRRELYMKRRRALHRKSQTKSLRASNVATVTATRRDFREM